VVIWWPGATIQQSDKLKLPFYPSNFFRRVISRRATSLSIAMEQILMGHNCRLCGLKIYAFPAEGGHKLNIMAAEKILE
jgi:hypothetical protein